MQINLRLLVALMRYFLMNHTEKNMIDLDLESLNNLKAMATLTKTLVLQDRGNNRETLNSKIHQTSTMKEISMDFILNSQAKIKLKIRTIVIIQVVNMIQTVTSMASKLVARKIHLLILILEKLKLAKQELRKNERNNKTKRSDGIQTTLTLGLEIKMIAKNFTLEKLVNKQMRNKVRKKIGGKLHLKKSKNIMMTTLKSLRKLGKLKSSTELSFNSSRTTAIR
jgi:hypothetical protein